MKLSSELKTGIVFVVALILFIWGYNFLKGKDLFKKEREFHAIYSQVNGLGISNPVYIKGIKVGFVESINFDPSNIDNIIVTLILSDPFEFPKSSVARIFSSDLMGSKAIELVVGNGQDIAQSGDTLKTSIQASLQEEVSIQMLPIKEKAENLMLSLDSVLSVVQNIFNEQTKDNIKNSLESIKRTIDNLEHTSYGIDTLITTQKSRLKQIMFNIESISRNIKNNNENLTNVIENFSAISDSIRSANIASTINNAEKSLKEVSMIVEKINTGEGSLGQLINNDTLYLNLEESAKNFEELLEDVKLNPQRYVRFSIFGGGKKKYSAPESE